MEKKIEALPSLSLEEFQEKKKQQRTKKKKPSQKLNTNLISKRPPANQNSVVNTLNNRKSPLEILDLHDEADKALLVGSQKRKARKQSITRNASATVSKNSAEETNQRKSKNIKLSINFFFHSIINFCVLFMLILAWCASPDLEALACLAELAANRTKLTK